MTVFLIYTVVCCMLVVPMLRSNRCLAKFKFFISELKHFFQNESLSSEVDELILLLLTSELSPEDFFALLQRRAGCPFDEYHVEIVKSGLPLLQEELRSFMSKDMNGTTSPQTPHFSPSQEFNSIDTNGEITPKIELFPSNHNEKIGELVSYYRNLGQVSLKRSCSNSLSIEPGESTTVSTVTLQKILRLSESMIPQLEEMCDFLSEVLTNGNNKEFTDSESNDSINLQDPDMEFNGQDQPMSDGGTPQKEIELCKNCNRRALFSCVCQRVGYCTPFCQTKDRDAHKRDFFCPCSYTHPITVQHALVSDSNSHEQTLIIRNGISAAVTTNNISPDTPIQPPSTSIYFQALPIVTSVPATPICSIAQPLK